MEQYGRTCRECGRNLPPAYTGELCAMCRQAGVEQQERERNAVVRPPTILQYEESGSHIYMPGIRLEMLAPHYQRQIRDIAGQERLNAALWVVIAILQICSVAFILLGVYNILVCLKAFARAKAIEALDPSVPESEEASLGPTILFIFINLFLGGVIGVASCILALNIRARILRIREAFEDPHACLDPRYSVGALEHGL